MTLKFGYECDTCGHDNKMHWHCWLECTMFDCNCKKFKHKVSIQ